MTQDELARSYFVKASKRRRVLEVLLEETAYSDVVREAQELVELALKGMLRKVGVDITQLTVQLSSPAARSPECAVAERPIP